MVEGDLDGNSHPVLSQNDFTRVDLTALADDIGLITNWIKMGEYDFFDGCLLSNPARFGRRHVAFAGPLVRERAVQDRDINTTAELHKRRALLAVA